MQGLVLQVVWFQEVAMPWMLLLLLRFLKEVHLAGVGIAGGSAVGRVLSWMVLHEGSSRCG